MHSKPGTATAVISGSINRRQLMQAGGGLATLAITAAFSPIDGQAAAPMLGVLRPNVYRFKLGGFEVTQILDGVRVGPGPHPTFGQDQSEETIHNLLKVNGLPPTNFDHHFVPTLVNTGKELVLFDTGNGKGRMALAGHLRDLLAPAGYSPEQVDDVVITHGLVLAWIE